MGWSQWCEMEISSIELRKLEQLTQKISSLVKKWNLASVIYTLADSKDVEWLMIDSTIVWCSSTFGWSNKKTRLVKKTNL